MFIRSTSARCAKSSRDSSAILRAARHWLLPFQQSLFVVHLGRAQRRIFDDYSSSQRRLRAVDIDDGGSASRHRSDCASRAVPFRSCRSRAWAPAFQNSLRSLQRLIGICHAVTSTVAKTPLSIAGDRNDVEHVNAARPWISYLRILRTAKPSS